MPIIDRHAPGSFNWFELATTDQAAAKEFYGKLFGWEAIDSPMGPDSFYTMFKLEGLDVGAAYTMGAEMRAQGTPSHWDIYIAVDSAEKTAAKIESSGGKLIAKPFDVMTYGRMAVAADPTGAVFCIWQPLSHIGSRITGVEGTACWADLNTPDPEAATHFYQEVFGWEFFKSPADPSGYTHIKHNGTPMGGIPPANTNIPPSWMLTFLASDVETLTNKAGALGATTLFPVTGMAEGKFSILADPQGAAFGLFQPADPSAS